MMEGHFLSPWQEFGLIGLMIGAIVFLLFLVVKWTLATTKDILAQAAKERECWMEAFSEHTEQAKLFHESVKEAHAYQREEHKEMINILGRINGYKHNGQS